MALTVLAALIVVLSVAGWFVYKGHSVRPAKPPEGVAEIKPYQRLKLNLRRRSQRLAAASHRLPIRGLRCEARHRCSNTITRKPSHILPGRSLRNRIIVLISAARAPIGNWSKWKRRSSIVDYSQAILLNPDSAAAYHDRALCELPAGSRQERCRRL